MTKTPLLPPVPTELRFKISNLLEQGKAPAAVAIALGIREIQVHQVIANQEHIQAKRDVSAHRAATKKLVGHFKRLGASDAGQGKQTCVILKTCTGTCRSCGKDVQGNLHAVHGHQERMKSQLSCADCCPVCVVPTPSNLVGSEK